MKVMTEIVVNGNMSYVAEDGSKIDFCFLGAFGRSKWVYRDMDGDIIDSDNFRYDLAERNDIKLVHIV